MKFFGWMGRLIAKKPGNSIFLFLLAALIGGWVLYINVNSDGIVTGLVVDEAGDPVFGATVVIREKTLNYTFPPIKVTTNGEGVYTFENIDMIEFIIEADKEHYRASEKKRYHLYFRGQHFKVPQPLRLVREVSKHSRIRIPVAGAKRRQGGAL
jgi:hypothetical protein